MLKRLPLTTSMLILTAVVGLVVWTVSDSYQHAELNEIFHLKLKEQFDKEVVGQRTRFDRFVKAYHPAVRTYAQMVNVRDYVEEVDWNLPGIKDHKWPPKWLPKTSMMRRFVLPRYAMLLDEYNQVREIYRYKNPMPPDELLNLSDDVLDSSHGQSYLAHIDGSLYIMSSAFIGAEDEGPRLLIMSPIDEEFLLASQGIAGNKSIALLNDEGLEVIVSSDHENIPTGALLDTLKENYLTTVAGHLGSGSSDLLVQFASFVSTADVRNQIDVVLNADRQIRAITALAYFLAFASVMYWVTYRIQRLTQKVVEFSNTRDAQASAPKRKNELLELEEQFELLIKAIQSETEALERQALHDPLTDMPNRKLLSERIHIELLKSSYTKQPFLVMVSDLDRFKEINDTLGHHIGDEVLQQVSARLQKTLRRDDVVARLGGDEFGMLLPNTSLDLCDAVANKIVKSFSHPVIVEGLSLNIGISVGVVEYPAHGRDINLLMQRADVAMYHAKTNKLGYSIYRSDEDKNTVGRLALMSEFREALGNNGLQLFYQPKFDLNKQRITSVEALLRWDHPIRGFVPPDEFIPLAEQTGLIMPLTLWVFNQALLDWKEWNASNHNVSMAVNMSVDCLQFSDFPQTIESILTEHQVPASNIIFELTESLFMKDAERAQKILHALDKFGIELSIDDFGTGYSSLAYLKQLPMDELKIDRSFVMDMLENENDEVIVKATIELAHAMGLRVVAEGVEDQAALDQLVKMGCDIAQGYFIAKPMPANEMSKLLEKEQASIC